MGVKGVSRYVTTLKWGLGVKGVSRHVTTLKCGLGDIETCGHPAIAVRMGLNGG